MERPFTRPGPGITRMTLLTAIFGELYIYHSSKHDPDFTDFVSATRIQLRCVCSLRYTYRPDTGAVYGTQTQVYQSTVVIGAVKTNSNSKISLLGYDGEVTWKPAANTTIEISMPHLPLDSGLKWAWVFKFENVAPAMKHYN